MLAAALIAAAVVLPAQGHVLLHRCVGAGGSWAHAALSLAILRNSPTCPEGAAGLGVVPSSAVVLASVALPVLAVWAFAWALGVSLAALAVRAAGLALRLVGCRVCVPLPAVELPVADRAPMVVRVPVVVPTARGLLVARPHRAPPLPA